MTILQMIILKFQSKIRGDYYDGRNDLLENYKLIEIKVKLKQSEQQAIENLKTVEQVAALRGISVSDLA